MNQELTLKLAESPQLGFDLAGIEPEMNSANWEIGISTARYLYKSD